MDENLARILDDWIPGVLHKSQIETLWNADLLTTDDPSRLSIDPCSIDLRISDIAFKMRCGSVKPSRNDGYFDKVLAALFPAVSVTVQNYENNTGSYNELTCGVVKLTQSRILTPQAVPRHARFRSTLAATGQYSLFHSENCDSEASYLYAILTHAVDTNSEKRSWPAFIKIQFPNSTCTAYVDEGIDLLARFPQLRAEYVPGAARIARLKRRRLQAQAGA